MSQTASGYLNIDELIAIAGSVSLKYDLQFFAQDGPGGEKTEPATPKKLEDARKEGQVAKGKELENGVMLLALFVSLKIFVGTLGKNFLEEFGKVYNKIPQLCKFVEGNVPEREVNIIFLSTLIDMLLILLPFFAIGIALAIVVNIIQVGWKVTSKPLQPKLNKLNPINGFKRIISKEKIVDLLLAIIKIALITYVAYTTLNKEFVVLFKLFDMDMVPAIQNIGNIAINMGLKISAVYIVFGIAEYMYRKWKFSEDMKMTKQEVKDEMKNSEGDPQIKGKQKQRMMEASRRRMMQAVPEADVVITNPTHFAVALKYDTEVFDAPYIVAKGEDFLAQKIKDLARENGVELVENKPLARMLYHNVDIGEPIPPELYHVVADILAAVYNAKKLA